MEPIRALPADNNKSRLFDQPPERWHSWGLAVMDLIKSGPEFVEYIDAPRYGRRELLRTFASIPKAGENPLHLFDGNPFLLRNDSRASPAAHKKLRLRDCSDKPFVRVGLLA